jgi:hypothetical protein
VTVDKGDYGEEDQERFPLAAGAHAGISRAVPQRTGEPRVDAMIARLDGLDAAALEEHVAVFEDTHVGLRQVLSDLDTAPDGAGADRHPGPGGR